MPRASLVSLGKYRRVGSACWRSARIDDTPPPQHQRITKHHYTHPTDPIRDKKTNAFDTSMASPSRQHNFAVRVSHRCIVIQSLGAPVTEGDKILSVGSILGAPAEFGRSRWVWALLPEGEGIYSLRWWWPVFTCIFMCVGFVSISRHLCSACGDRVWPEEGRDSFRVVTRKERLEI